MQELIALQESVICPPVLTHGDLSSFNILLRDDEVVGIIDWEITGWSPYYWDAALVLALKDGYTCTALARTPSKLTSLLLFQGISELTISTNLHIRTGDIRDISAVKATPTLNDEVVDLIISGIGMLPVSACLREKAPK
jgi:hypothetical protein